MAVTLFLIGPTFRGIFLDMSDLIKVFCPFLITERRHAREMFVSKYHFIVLMNTIIGCLVSTFWRILYT